MSKGRVLFRIVVGGYLAYMGFSLAGRAISERPENYILYTAIGVIFLAVGVVWCAGALLRFARHDYDDGTGEGRKEDKNSIEEKEED